jgi:transposase
MTLIRIFEKLRTLGYGGGYDAVRRYARGWSKAHSSATADGFVSLTFAPGEAYQFEWSHEIVVLNGVTTTVKVAHLRLCHSRMMFVRAYPLETQEMVFDAHERAFAFFKGACARRVYDNMKRRWRRCLSARTASTIAHSSRCARTISSSRSSARRPRAGRRPGREPGRPGARTLLHAAPAVQVL